MNVFYGYVKCYAWEIIYNRYFSSKNKSEKIDFQIPGFHISMLLSQCLYDLYFLMAYSFGYLMTQYRLG